MDEVSSHVCGGARVGRTFGGSHLGAARGDFARGVACRHLAQARHFGHERRFEHRRHFVPGGFGFYDYDYPCSYGDPYSTSYSCYG